MIIQSESFTIDVTRYEIDILRRTIRAIKDLYQLLEFDEDDSKDKEIAEHLLIKLEKDLYQLLEFDEDDSKDKEIVEHLLIKLEDALRLR